MKNELEDDLAIDKYKLDEECISHASRYAYYADKQVEAKSEVSKAKDRLDYVIAERNMAIRKRYSDEGMKFTESVINSELSMDEEVLEAKAEVRKAEEVLGHITVAVSAMDSRRSELDNLTKLYVSGYYSSGDTLANNKTNVLNSLNCRKALNKKSNREEE